MTGDKKNNPLWTFMPRMAYTPPPKPSRDDERGPPPREITEEDMKPLRIEHEWRPSVVMSDFPCATGEREHLPRLIVACAVIQGVHRLLELTERLFGLLTFCLPRVERMVEDEALEQRKDMLEDLFARLKLAKQELIQTRARAANDIDCDPSNPDGLRVVDLDILVAATESLVLAHEITSRRNVTGIDFARAVCYQPPDLGYAEEWLERLLGSAEMTGILLFWPRDYGRVVVVYKDGRLAYDPGATPDLEEEEELEEDDFDY